MKINLKTRDLEIVGVIGKGSRAYDWVCANYDVLGLIKEPAPIFRKTAEDYKLRCAQCGQPLA